MQTTSSSPPTSKLRFLRHLLPQHNPLRLTTASPKIYILLWKNSIVHVRRPLWSLAALLAPILFFVFVAFYNLLGHAVVPYTETRFDSVACMRPIQDFFVGYATNRSGAVRVLMDLMQKKLPKESRNVRLRGYANSNELERALFALNSTRMVGVDFHEEDLKPDGSLQALLKYHLRFPSELQFASTRPPIFEKRNYWHTEDGGVAMETLLFPNTVTIPDYHKEYFVTFQTAIYLAYLNMLTNAPYLRLDTVRLQRLPQKHNAFSTYLLTAPFCTFFFVTYGICIGLLCLPFAMERNRRTDKYFAIFGIPRWLNMLSWYILNVASLLVLAAFGTIACKLGGIVGLPHHSAMPSAEGTMVFALFAIYGAAYLAWQMFIVSLFREPLTTISISLIGHFMLIFPFCKETDLLDVRDYSLWLSCHRVFHRAISQIRDTEMDLNGTRWSDGISPPNVGYFSVLLLSHTLIVLLSITIISLLLDRSDCIPFHWNRLRRAIAKCYRRRVGTTQAPSASQSRIFDPFTYEKPLQRDQPAVVHVRRVSKRQTLTDVSLDIFANEVLAVYGPHGAGKSTLVHLLTLDSYPTKGTIRYIEPRQSRSFAHAQDDEKEEDQPVRGQGIAHGGNPLWIIPEMTVVEHMRFFACAARVPERALDRQVQSLITVLFPEFADDPLAVARRASRLNHDARMRLSLGVAFVGMTRLVLLDAPTEHVTAETRKRIWILIQHECVERTIVLATPHMAEAEALSTRIAVLNHGRLCCVGSAFFLGKLTGAAAYYLTAEKAANFSERRAHDAVFESIPFAKIYSNKQTEIVYLLDNLANETLLTLLAQLENDDVMADLKITKITLKHLSLEEVFARLGDGIGELIVPRRMNIPVCRDVTVRIGGATVQQAVSRAMSMRVQSISRSSFVGFPPCEGMECARLRLHQWQIVKYCILLNSVASALTLLGVIFVIMLPILLVYNHMFYHTRNLEKPAEHLILTEFRNVILLEESQEQPPSPAYQAFLQAAIKYYQNKTNVPLKIVPDIEKHALTHNARNLYHDTALRLRNGTLTVFYNDAYYHCAAKSLADAFNLVSLTYNGFVATLNYPLPKRINSELNEFDYADACSFADAFTLSMVLVAAFLTAFAIGSQRRRTDHMMHLYGAGYVNTWMINFVIHWLMYMFYTMIMVGVLSLLYYQWSKRWNMDVIVLMFVFGMCAVSSAPVIARLFRRPTTGFNLIIIVLYGTFVCMSVLQLVLAKSVLEYALDWVYYTVPNLSLWIAARHRYRRDFNLHQCDFARQYCNELQANHTFDCFQFYCAANTLCCDSYRTDLVFGNYGILAIIIIDLVVAFLFWPLGLALDYKIFVKLMYAFRLQGDTEIEKEAPTAIGPPMGGMLAVSARTRDDEDVLKEARMVKALSEANYIDYTIVVCELKVLRYGAVVLNGISFALKAGECFGVLAGHRGGKSTLCETLIGMVEFAAGEVFVSGRNLKYDRRTISAFLGYNMPATTCFPPDIRVARLVCLLAALRGHAREHAEKYVQTACEEMDVSGALRQRLKQLDIIKRQKIAVVLAFIGNPQLVILDTPTRGLDYEDKRKVWLFIARRIRSGNIAIVLTTGSLQECEAICGRVALLNNGAFQMMGTLAQIRSKHARGVMLVLHVRGADEVLRRVDVFVRKNFIAVLRDQQFGRLTYHIDDNHLQYSQIFEMVERARGVLPILDYSVSCASFENALVRLMKN